MLVDADHEGQIVDAMQAILRNVHRYTDNSPKKVREMLEVYLCRHQGDYGEEEKKQIRYSLDVTFFKFYMAAISLEQLWALNVTARANLLQALENSLDRIDCSDDDLLLASYALECCLFEANSFLDIYMFYISQLLGKPRVGNMTKDRFYKDVQSVSDGRFRAKACRIKDYFDTNVFASESKVGVFVDPAWGSILISLRDKIAHRDRIRPSFASDERLLDKVLLNWPMLRGQTYERFLQSLQNGMWSMLTEDLAPILYDLPWKPGQYTEGMWSD
jgi:hypothetical protein